jgi:hypothetical protein
MKARKKLGGTKARIRAEKRHDRRIVTAIFLTVILSCVALSAYFGYTILSSSPDLSLIEPTLQFKPENPNPELKAVIVDQLSLTSPNQVFIQAAVDILERVNYSIDYYAGENVTVEFYRNLPAHGYKVILLRVHSAGRTLSGGEDLALFTSQTYSFNEYVTEQLAGQVGGVMYNLGDKILYFGIHQKFVLQCMKGTFNNTIIIAMGCNGLAGTEMANAFVEKGAETYISWNGSVSVSHAETATTRLLQLLVNNGQIIRQAVENTIKDVGQDPTCNNTLEYYPIGSGDYRIQT